MAHFRLTPPRLKLSENDVEKACLDVLRVRHFCPLRLQSGRFWTLDKKRIVTVGEPGIPDYVIPKFFVECKAPGQSVSEVQREKIWTLEKHWGVETAVVESVEELMEWLARKQGR